jgi:hypothetical protein
MRGCIPGLVHRWLWFEWPDEAFPEEGDIVIRETTGSCWLVLSVKPSRKGGRWRTAQVEGLGTGAAEPDDDGTFTLVPWTTEMREAVEMIEHAERQEARDAAGRN